MAMQYCKLLYTSIYLKNLKVTALLKMVCITYHMYASYIICIDIIFHVIIMVHVDSKGFFGDCSIRKWYASM